MAPCALLRCCYDKYWPTATRDRLLNHIQILLMLEHCQLFKLDIENYTCRSAQTLRDAEGMLGLLRKTSGSLIVKCILPWLLML